VVREVGPIKEYPTALAGQDTHMLVSVFSLPAVLCLAQLRNDFSSSYLPTELVFSRVIGIFMRTLRQEAD
jgi:predicted neutral ceramidase superfamily lipid hydrolase